MSPAMNEALRNERSGAPNFDANQIEAPIQISVPLIDSAQSLPVPSTGIPKHPVKLSLQEALPCLPHDNMMHDVQVNFEALMQPWQDDAMFSTLDFLDHLPDMTTEFKHMLAAVPAWRHEPVLQCHVFLDGSSFIMHRQATEKAPAAWAIIVILECAVQDNDYPFRFLCAKSHPLEPCQGHVKSNQYVGELLYDSLTAEATAMIWALSWSIQSTFTCHTCFHYDNMTVGPFTEGVAQWKCEWEYQVLKRNISTLRHFMQSMGRSFSFSHLKAHVGHPWSEAVDNLAKAVAKQVVLPPNAVNIVSKALNSPASSFAWLLNSDPKQTPAIAALRATFKAEGPFPQQVQPDVTWKHDTAAVRQELATVRIGFASANVLTLDGGKQSQQQKGLMQLGRIANLQAQFCASNCTIIGLQECRTSGAITRHSATHLVFQSGADVSGVRGCELWLSRIRPYAVAKKKEFHFEQKHVTITSFDDRHILALIQAPHLQLKILVVHAPHQGAQDVDLDQWWQHIQQAIQRTPSTIQLVVLGDLNARLGSVVSSAVDSHQADEETETGHHVHAFLLENSLFAPSTYQEYHEGDAHTWISPIGQLCCIDFVMVPQNWKSLSLTSKVQYDIDLALARHDHFVTGLEVIMTRQNSSRSVTSRCSIDTRKCYDPKARAQFIQYLQHPPQVEWSRGAGDHAEEVVTWLQKGAQASFACDKTLPRQKYLSANTWQIVQVRKQLDAMFRSSHKTRQQVTRQVFFGKWLQAYRCRTQVQLLSTTLHIDQLRQFSGLLK